jgi:hypothetical protein
MIFRIEAAIEPGIGSAVKPVTKPVTQQGLNFDEGISDAF